jgi:hypothetical protein
LTGTFINNINQRLKEIEAERAALITLVNLYSGRSGTPSSPLSGPLTTRQAVLHVVAANPQGIEIRAMIHAAREVVHSRSKDIDRMLRWEANHLTRRSEIIRRGNLLLPNT